MRMREPTDEHITRELRSWVDDLAARVPPHGAARGVPTDGLHGGDVEVMPILPTGRRWRWVAGAVAACVLAAALVWIGRIPDHDDAVVTNRPTTTVDYERIKYTQSTNVTCPDGQLQRSGRFDDATMEFWSDVAGKRFRERVTYPDHTKVDVISRGSPYYPDAKWIRGRPRGASYECEGIGIALPGPGADGGPGLNSQAPKPRLSDLPGGVPDGREDMPAVVGYRELGTLVDAADHDSLGRLAQRWEQRVEGTYTDGPSSAPTGRIVQLQTWFVDPSSGRVLEDVFVDTTDNLGTSTWRQVVVDSGRRSVPGDHFDTGGYHEEPVP
jgi:hypothetical protein